MSGVAFLFDLFAVAIPVEILAAQVGKVVEHAKVVAVVVVKAARGGQVGGLEFAEVPFAGDGGGVAGIVQRIGQGALGERQAPGGVRAYNGVHTGVCGVAARH